MKTTLDSQFHLDREGKFVLKLLSFALRSVGVESYTGGNYKPCGSRLLCTNTKGRFLTQMRISRNTRSVTLCFAQYYQRALHSKPEPSRFTHTQRHTHARTRVRACTDTHIHLITFCLLKSMKLWKVFSRGMLLQSPQYLSNKRAFPEQTALGVECGSTVPSGGLRASFMLRLLFLKRSKTYCLQIILKLPQSLRRHGNNYNYSKSGGRECVARWWGVPEQNFGGSNPSWCSNSRSS